MALPVISVEQMRRWERASWAAGRKEGAVIAAVGRALAARLVAGSSPGDLIVLLAGAGHNGDDARAAVRHLRGRKVALIEVGKDPGAAVREFSKLISQRPKWVVDALFGIGLNRALTGDWKNLIDVVNAAGWPVLAMDVPSGLDADTGEVMGAAVRADVTLTVGAPKRGLLRAGEWVGRLEVAAEVGLVACEEKSDLKWTLPEDFADFPPRRRAESNKGSYGHAVLVAGSVGYHGAAVLTARGAMRARAGLVTVVTQAGVYGAVAAQLQGAMVRPWRRGENLPERCTAVLTGPGLAQKNLPAAMKAELRELWRNFPGAVIVDASALDWLEAGKKFTAEQVRLVTPHPGEAGRLLGISVAAVQADRVAALRAISRRLGGCYVVLKGNLTLVGRETGQIFVNNSGDAGLAQGGSGDLLGGYLAGLLAQPGLREEVMRTIRYGVWRHGLAAEEMSAQRRDWTVEELAGVLGE